MLILLPSYVSNAIRLALHALGPQYLSVYLAILLHFISLYQIIIMNQIKLVIARIIAE